MLKITVENTKATTTAAAAIAAMTTAAAATTVAAATADGPRPAGGATPAERSGGDTRPCLDFHLWNKIASVFFFNFFK